MAPERTEIRRARRRSAFTLTEMLVALAVTVLALAVVTNVFSVTTRTAAVSAAIGEVEMLARNFADQLQQDLEYCDPSRSILVIHGRTQAAALTEELRQGQQYYRVLTGDPGLVTPGYDPRFDPSAATPNGTAPRDQFSDPRADILMLFTNRPSVSKAPPTGLPADSFQAKLQAGARVSPIQVVYGHGALDRAIRSGNTWVFANNLRHIEDVDSSGLSLLPANRWHVARRATLLDPNTPRDPTNGFNYATGGEVVWDRIGRCYSASQGFAADAAQLRFADYLALFAPGSHRWEPGIIPNRALLSPYRFSGGGSAQQGLAWPSGDRNLVFNVLYPNGVETNHHVATVIEQPPAALQSNLGLDLLPGCVWFQIEFLLPEDPRDGLDHPLSDQRRDTPRWVGVEPGETYVFVPDTDENRQLVERQVYPSPPVRAGRALPLPSRLQTFAQVIRPALATAIGMPHNGDTADNRRVRMWPYAIRVTVRVIDQRGRLEEPIVRSVVHRFD